MGSNDISGDQKFKFDTERYTLERAGKLIPLPHKALELLKLLVSRHGQFVSKKEIFDAIWADTFVEEGVLTQNIYTLRKILGKNADGSHKIENLARRGYRLANLNDFEITGDHKLERTAAPHTSTLQTLWPGRKLMFASFATAGAALLAVFLFSLITRQSAGTEIGHLENVSFSQLTDTGDASYLAISPAGDRVAYSRDVGLFVKDLLSNTETNVIIEGSPRIGCVQFGNEGSTIFFGTLTNRDEKGSIFRVSPTGGKADEIATNVWSGFSLSPNGEKLAFVRKSTSENKQYLVVKDLTTSIEAELASISLPEEFYWNNYPAWSVDGSLIAMVAVKQTEHFSRIIVIDERGKTRDVKPEGFRNIEQIVWSSDPDSFIAAGNDGKNFQLWKIDQRSGISRRITNDLNSYLGIGVSADRRSLVSRQRVYYSNIWIGSKNNLKELQQMTSGMSRNDGLRGLTWLDDDNVVYTSNDERIRDWNLWLLNVTDGTRKKLTTDTETQNDSPAISRIDGSIFFSSDRNKASRIWRVDRDGTSLRQITFGEDETHHFPQISPDGKWLYFLIRSGRSSTIGRRSLVDNSTQELAGKANYTAGNFLTLSPDGQKLAFQNIGYVKQSESSQRMLQIAIIPVDDPQNVEFHEVDAWWQRAEWSSDGTAIDFVGGDVKNSIINRLPTAPGSTPSALLTTNDSIIFNLAWSPSGEKIAVARGKLLRDVVLLTNFAK